jgi:hypothetical protein
MLFTIELDGELTGENVKELRSVRMQVALFGGAGRHALFDHAEGAGAMEMPAITEDGADGAGPGVVFGVVGADNLHCGGLLASEQCARDDRVHNEAQSACIATHRGLALQMNTISLSLFVAVICELHGFCPSLSGLANSF